MLNVLRPQLKHEGRGTRLVFSEKAFLIFRAVFLDEGPIGTSGVKILPGTGRSAPSCHPGLQELNASC